MLSHGAARHPENVAVVFRDVSLTYRELEALTNRFARALTRLGVGKGDRVCLLTTNCPEYIIAFYAIARVGAVASPMNPSYREREIEYQLNDTEAVAVVVHADLVPLVEAVRARTLPLRQVVGMVSGPSRACSSWNAIGSRSSSWCRRSSSCSRTGRIWRSTICRACG